MCASYGLDPRFSDPEAILAGDEELIENLRSWAHENANETLLPTGKNLRNLNPIITERDGARILEHAWWGYLVAGQPAKFPSINTRSERLAERTGPLPARAIVPATRWFEMQKPNRRWFQFGRDQLDLFAMAAVTQPGRTADGATFTCYSVVMRPASGSLASIHDRMPILIPASFTTEWLTSTATSAQLLHEALGESDAAAALFTAKPLESRP